MENFTTKIKKDFNLPNFPFKKHITNTFKILDESLERQPDIITYGEIKRSTNNISPINYLPEQKLNIKKYKQNDLPENTLNYQKKLKIIREKHLQD